MYDKRRAKEGVVVGGISLQFTTLIYLQVIANDLKLKFVKQKKGVVVGGIPLQFTGLYFTQHPSSLILHTIHQSLERETKKNNMKSTI